MTNDPKLPGDVESSTATEDAKLDRRELLLMAGAGHGNYSLITIAVLNMVVSLYYYLKIIKAVFMDTNENPIIRVTTPLSSKLALIICTTGIILIGFIGYIYEYIFSISTAF